MIKNLLFVISLILTVGYVYAQTETITDLTLKKEKIQHKIKLLNDSLTIIDKNIAKVNSKELISQLKNVKIDATIISGGKIKDAPTPIGNTIETLQQERKVYIVDYDNEYFKICDNDLCGYVSTLWIEGSPEISKYVADKKVLAYEIKEENIRRQISANEMQNKKREESLIKKWGVNTYNSLRKGNFWLGMTSEMAIVAFGNPNKINETVGTWGEHEQWVFDNIYLYFENGKLTSYQR